MENSDCTKESCARLDPPSLGFALGITWGLIVLIMSILAHFTSLPNPLVVMLSFGYIGMKTSFASVFLAFLWACIDGFIVGSILGLVYNYSVAHKDKVI